MTRARSGRDLWVRGIGLAAAILAALLAAYNIKNLFVQDADRSFLEHLRRDDARVVIDRYIADSLSAHVRSHHGGER